jgi:prevent-host-death family protein
MRERHSIPDARRVLPSLVRKAEQGEVVELARDGEPVVLLIGWKLYERLTMKRRSFSEAYEEFTRRYDLRELGIVPEDVFGDTRGETRRPDLDL